MTRRNMSVRMEQPLIDQIDAEWHRRALKSREETIRTLLGEAIAAATPREFPAHTGTVAAWINGGSNVSGFPNHGREITSPLAGTIEDPPVHVGECLTNDERPMTYKGSATFRDGPAVVYERPTLPAVIGYPDSVEYDGGPILNWPWPFGRKQS